MAVNLVSLVMQFLTPDMIGRIATALGVDRNLLQAAINAAVPGILGGLTGVAAQPGGAQRIADAAQQQTNSLGNIANVLGAGNQTALSCSHRCWADAIKMRSSMRSPSFRGLAKAKLVHCWECWLR